MGKIRRARTKRHIEAVKNKTSEESSKTTQFLPNESTLPALFPINNLFKLAQETSKIDEVNNVAVKEGEKIDINEEKLTTKKDKRKLRHEKFLKKLHASKANEDNKKAIKKRQKTVITGDLNPLTQALLDIDKLPVVKPDKKKRKNKKKQNKSTSSERKRLNAQISDMDRFKQVLQHPSFKSNPLSTIDEHIRNVIKQQTDN